MDVGELPGEITAVETLRRRAAFARSRGSDRFAEEMLAVADRGEEASEAYLNEIRNIGKSIVDAALLSALAKKGRE